MQVVLRKIGWIVFLIKKYVDDINVMMEAIKRGYRWKNGGLTWSHEDMKIDLESGKSLTRINMEVFTNLANSVYPSLNFTMDLAEDHLDLKVPMLDFCVWTSSILDCTRASGYRQVVKHEFYVL